MWNLQPDVYSANLLFPLLLFRLKRNKKKNKNVLGALEIMAALLLVALIKAIQMCPSSREWGTCGTSKL